MAEEREQRRPLSERISWNRVSPLLREAFEIAWKRRSRLLLAFPLILLNRIASLVLPGTTKFLIDDVIGKQDYDLLPILAFAAAGAAVIEAICGFTLAMLLGMEAQKSITEYRRKIQKHLQRLPTSYCDGAKTGTLLSRTMWDAEGIRNLVGTGLVQLAASSVMKKPARIDGQPTPNGPSGSPSAIKAINARRMRPSLVYRFTFVQVFNVNPIYPGSSGNHLRFYTNKRKVYRTGTF